MFIGGEVYRGTIVYFWHPIKYTVFWKKNSHNKTFFFSKTILRNWFCHTDDLVLKITPQISREVVFIILSPWVSINNCFPGNSILSKEIKNRLVVLTPPNEGRPYIRNQPFWFKRSQRNCKTVLSKVSTSKCSLQSNFRFRSSSV